MMLLIIYSVLIILSLLIGYIGCMKVSIKIFMNRFAKFNYHLGVSYREYSSRDPNDPHSLQVLSIGLLFFEFQLEFLKKNR